MPALYSQLLDPAAGLCRGHHVGRLPGSVALFGLAIDVGLRLGPDEEAGLDDRAGAMGFTLSDCYARGVGEAVERFALMPGPMPLPGRRLVARADLVSCGIACVDPAAGWGFPHLEPDARHDWYFAQDLASKATAAVPTWWVDVPSSLVAPGWQGCPSGVAAHLSVAQATQSALSEVVERDAVMRAWADPTKGVQEVPLDGAIAALRATANRDQRGLGQRLGALVRGAEPGVIRAYRLTCSVTGEIVYLAWLSTGEIAAAGAGAGADEPHSLVKAVREAWQAGHVLTQLSTNGPPRPPDDDGYVQRSHQRMVHWSSGTGVHAFHHWLEAMPPDNRLAPDELQALWLEDAPRFRPEERQVLRVDLTHRLPEPVRTFGFSAVKVFVAGTQPLLVAEGEPWSYCDPQVRPVRPDGLLQPLI